MKPPAPSEEKGMPKWFMVVDDSCSYLDDPEEMEERGFWTLSEDPNRTGWETDGGYPGYGLTKAKAQELLTAVNAYATNQATIAELKEALEDDCFNHSELIENQQATINSLREMIISLLDYVPASCWEGECMCADWGKHDREKDLIFKANQLLTTTKGEEYQPHEPSMVDEGDMTP